MVDQLDPGLDSPSHAALPGPAHRTPSLRFRAGRSGLWASCEAAHSLQGRRVRPSQGPLSPLPAPTCNHVTSLIRPREVCLRQERQERRSRHRACLHRCFGFYQLCGIRGPALTSCPFRSLPATGPLNPLGTACPTPTCQMEEPQGRAGRLGARPGPPLWDLSAGVWVGSGWANGGGSGDPPQRGGGRAGVRRAPKAPGRSQGDSRQN